MPIETLISAAAAMHWNDVVLLADDYCSWNTTPAEVHQLLTDAANRHNVRDDKDSRFSCPMTQNPVLSVQQVTIHASDGGANASCVDAGIESNFILLLIMNDPEDAARVLVNAYQRGWLDGRCD